MTSPYSNLPKRAYWRSGVAERPPLEPGDLFQPKFPVTRSQRVTTAGSCFAQHVGRALRGAGFNVTDTEPLPDDVPDAVAQRFGYRLYSARYGNIYTVRQLLQLAREVEGIAAPADPVWVKDGRYYDSQRPGVEPEGLESPELVALHRAAHLRAVRKAFRSADLFVFTLGLTEAWVHRASGTVFPTAPGTIAGSYDPAVYAFKNFTAAEILADFEAFRSLVHGFNPDMRFVITVSPVPLTATATRHHVEVATAYSKAVLRTVCGMLSDSHDDIDYFPSYEIITSQTARGAYYESNQRSVTARGVATAMALFLKAHGVSDTTPTRPAAGDAVEDVVCEDALLEAFAT